MQRTLAIVISGLLILGFISAWVPAQDPSNVPWKLPGKRRPAGSDATREDAASEEESSASEPAQFPMDAASNLHATPSDEAITDSNVRQAQLRRRAYRDRQRGGDSPSPSAAEEPTAAEPDAGPQHSILKRGPQAVYAAPEIEEASPSDQGPSNPSPSNSGDSGSARRPSRPTRVPTAPPASSAKVEELHVSSRMPSLRIELVGPGAIQVGQESRYTIYANNDGDTPAQDILVRLPLPSSINLTKGESTIGEAEVQSGEDGALALVWSIPSLAARAHETLHMQVVPSSAEGIELELQWACQPAAASARVVVKEPQLNLTLTGPGDMLLGEEKVFTLIVSNPGSGDAAGVSIDLTSGAGKPEKIDVGIVPAGQQVEVPVQVAATQPGEMAIKAVASAEGDLSADAAAKVLVRSAELAVAIDGPQLKFAGAEATYVVAVANRGNAAAEATSVSVQLPDEAKYIGGVDGAATSKSHVKWNVGVIAPGAEKTFEVRCQLLADGENRLLARAETKHGIAGEGEAVTEVQSVADLKLVVNDPAGPSPVGEEVVYDIELSNRGTKAAQQVKLLMQFGAGIEPIGIAGGKGKIVPGQVVFEPIASLAAGEQIVVKVRAKAEQDGTHQFRVEATSSGDGTRLVTEGTSRFFSDSRGGSEPAQAAAKPPTKTAARSQLPTPAKKR